MKITDEKSVARLWKSGRLSLFRDDLGNLIEVICAGRESTRPGCDFQDVVISVNSKKLAGDVEIHVTSDLWKKHGHHEDPAYNGVILHVVMWQKGELPVRLEEGSSLPTVILSRYVRSDELSRWREKAMRPCCYAVGWGAGLREVLLRAGLDRFKLKAGRVSVALQCEGTEQVLYKGICRALGYSRNVLPFETLAEKLPIEDIYNLTAGSLLRKKALLLGCAGFLPAPDNVSDIQLDEPEMAAMTIEWRSMGLISRQMSGRDWLFSNVRPSNHPVKRLTYLAHLLHKYELAGLDKVLLGIIRNAGPGAEAKCLEQALKAVEVSSLLGSGRAREMVVNQVLPFAFACGMWTGDAELVCRSLSIYLGYGALADNEILRYMRSLLLSDGAHGLNACAQQGMLHIYHEFCRTKDCVLCPVSKCRKPDLG